MLFSPDQARKVMDQYRISLCHYSWGIIAGSNVRHTCAAGLYLLSKAGGIEKIQALVDETLKQRRSDWRESIAKQLGASPDYVLGLESGFEGFESADSQHNPDYAHGVVDGRTLDMEIYRNYQDIN